MTKQSGNLLPFSGKSGPLVIQGPIGIIQALWDEPPQAVCRGVVLICHPHPLHGGTMENKVVYALHRAAIKAGFASLRFNFRGVGTSAGMHDGSVGETEDTVFLGGWLRSKMPLPMPLILAGFSFGAFVALAAAWQLRANGLVSIAPPFGRYLGQRENPPAPRCVWRVLHSLDDPVVSYHETLAQLQAYVPPPTLITVDGAGHFFHGRLNDVAEVMGAGLQDVAI